MNKKLIKFLNIIPDRIYLNLAYLKFMHKKLNLKNPKTFNEKLQWLKLYDRNPIYTQLVDKYEVRDFVADKIGNQYLIPLLGIWDNFDEIDFKKLPEKFVLKSTHDSGGIKICKNRSEFDKIEAKQFFEKSLKYNFYYFGREWPYKNVKPRLIAEQYMEDDSGYELKDYKFFCFNGEPQYMFIATDRNKSDEETKFDFFDMNFKHLPLKNGHPNSNKELKKPYCFDEMKKLARILSENIPHVRVDFYEINQRVYFGELTFYHWSGFVPFEPEEWDYNFGKLVKINEV